MIEARDRHCTFPEVLKTHSIIFIDLPKATDSLTGTNGCFLPAIGTSVPAPGVNWPEQLIYAQYDGEVDRRSADVGVEGLG
jgi:hypothetical protein